MRSQSVDHIVTLKELGQLRVIPVGGVTIERGQPSQSLWLVETGEFAVVRDDRGPLDAVATARPGDLLGLLGFIDGKPASASVVATTAAQVWEVPSSVVRDRALEDSDFAAWFYLEVARALTSNLRGSEHHLLDALFEEQHPIRLGNEVAKLRSDRRTGVEVARLRNVMQDLTLSEATLAARGTIIRDGLPRTDRRERVVIVGAGVAGLV